ncbi:hypothetical protein AAJCM20276_00070 [Acetobacter aceti]|uniref:Uncharacterized protein n=1 Tax=Acetobacter aceti TaxID=435 RepID=A0A6S6PDT6_ACEAC|nr:hypothetical protein AAJCM20276_00070 [Acetobacter aceti]
MIAGDDGAGLRHAIKPARGGKTFLVRAQIGEIACDGQSIGAAGLDIAHDGGERTGSVNMASVEAP